MTSRNRDYRIGALSKETGVHIETIRYYEKVGLLPPPPRTSGGYRIYSEDHLHRLVFVRRSRELGFSLDETRDLLGFVDTGNYTCSEVRDLAIDHLKNIRDKIADLKRMETTLDETVKRCTGDKTPDCAILESLSR